MTIELPEELEVALKIQANARGLSPAIYVREVLERALEPETRQDASQTPLKGSLGAWAKYGPAPSAEEIDENRAEMFRNFGQDF